MKVVVISGIFGSGKMLFVKMLFYFLLCFFVFFDDFVDD